MHSHHEEAFVLVWNPLWVSNVVICFGAICCFEAVRLAVWLIIGLVIYALYGIRHSRAQTAVVGQRA